MHNVGHHIVIYWGNKIWHLFFTFIFHFVVACVPQLYTVHCSYLFPCQSYAFIKQEQLQVLAEQLDAGQPKEVKKKVWCDHWHCSIAFICRNVQMCWGLCTLTRCMWCVSGEAATQANNNTWLCVIVPNARCVGRPCRSCAAPLPLTCWAVRAGAACAPASLLCSMTPTLTSVWVCLVKLFGLLAACPICLHSKEQCCPSGVDRGLFLCESLQKTKSFPFECIFWLHHIFDIQSCLMLTMSIFSFYLI